MSIKRDRIRYLILVQLGVVTQERIKECFPRVRKYLEGISGGEMKMIFATPSGDAVGCLFKTHLYAHKIITDLMGTSQNPPAGSSILYRDDSAIVVEVGEDFSGTGFSQGWNWLQHH